MKRDEKNVLSRQRILDAAMEEFAGKGYEGASLSSACAEKGLSKGLVYHHFRDKDELYLLCVQTCFDALAAHLATAQLTGSARERLGGYFDARLRFFAEHPLLLGIFADATFSPPPHLAGEIAARRRALNDLSLSLLTALLQSEPLREGLCAQTVVEDFRMYMDFFNLRFRAGLRAGQNVQEALREHEERCRQQLDILLYGVWKPKEES